MSKPIAPMALVTGGSTGIGLEACKQFIDQGYQVLNLSRRPAEYEHPDLISIEADLANRQHTEKVAEQIAETYAVSVFVHNAGVIRANLVEDVKLDDLDYLNQLHLGCAITLVQALLPAMKAAQHGRIILMSSRASVGMSTRSSYSATKSGMIALARTWALELGEHGITVNCVAPGPIASTEMFHGVIPEDSPKMREMAEKIPVKRLGQPEDVARAVLFLADPGNGFITGQNLFVCGGTSIGSI